MYILYNISYVEMYTTLYIKNDKFKLKTYTFIKIN